MAAIQLQLPNPFDFKQPDEWPRWKRQFEQYSGASGLSGETEARQVSTLLYCMGPEAGDVLATTTISDVDRAKYETVLKMFDAFFQVHLNVIFERACFNRRNQQIREPAEQYITALYGLIESCNYGELWDKLLRDRLVVSIADQALPEWLQLKVDLTLDNAKKIIRQKEAVNDHHHQLRSSGDGTKKNPVELDAVSGAGRPRTARRKPQQKPWSSKPQGASGSSAGKQPCKCCGKEHLKGDRCPAKGATCFKCNRLGNFGAQCLSKTVGEAIQELETVFLGAVTETGQSAWKATVQVLGQPIQFKMDTGAEVTPINEDTFKRFSKVQL